MDRGTCQATVYGVTKSWTGLKWLSTHNRNFWNSSLIPVTCGGTDVGDIGPRAGHLGFVSSVQFSCSVVPDSLRPHGLQHASPPCPSPAPEPTQTHVHWVGDAIQPSHPLSSPSLPTFNLSQHQGLFKWVSSSHQVAKVLELQLQHQSFQWIFRSDFR